MAYTMTQAVDTQEGHGALLQRFRDTVPKEVQARVLRFVIDNSDMSPEQVATLLRNTLEHAQENGLLAAPNGMELMNEVGMLGQQHANGLTTTTSEDIARMTAAVQATVEQMIGAGASPEAIQQAVGNLPMVTPELSQLAEQTAKQRIDAEQFNLISTRNQEQQQEFAALKFSLAELYNKPILELAAPKDAPVQEQEQQGPASLFASLIKGEKAVLASFALMQGDTQSFSPANSGLLGAPPQGQVAQRGNDTGWSLA